MKKSFFVFLLPLLTLVSCSGGDISSTTPVSSSSDTSSGDSSNSSSLGDDSSSSSSSSDSSSSSSEVPDNLPALREVMSNLASLRNYTYTIDDQILGVTTTFRYIENAYYYEPSQEEHGGQAYGYAQSNDNQVFEYAISNGEVVPGEVSRDSNGTIMTDLWNQQIISFYDFRIDAFTDVKAEDNIYQITDETNKLLFALLAGYGDAIAMNYITVSVEVLSENTIKSIVHFEPDNPSYVGDCIGIISSIGTTTIPEIEEYLASGGGPRLDTASDLYALLETLKASKKYQISVEVTDSEGAVSEQYEYIYNDNYYHRADLITTSNERGYVVVGESIYNFTLVNSEVVVGNEITYTGDAPHNDLWTQLASSMKSFANINLADLTVTDNGDETFTLRNNTSVFNTFAGICFTGTWGIVNVDPENDYIIFSALDENSFSFTYHSATYGDASATVQGIGTYSNDILDAFIEENKDFDSSDISELKEFLNELKNSNNYTISIDNNFSSFAPTLATGDATIYFTEDNYLYSSTNDEAKSFGYLLDVDGIYSYKVSSGSLTEKTKIEVTSLYQSDLFKAFSDYSYDELEGNKSFTGTYTLSDDAFLSAIASVLSLDADSFVTNVSSISFSIIDNGATISASTAFYGSLTATISNIGTTSIVLA